MRRPHAFIPARAGSKRLPGKVLADLGGKPLLAWTVEAALASEAFEDVVVCSEDETVRAVARQCGASACDRPAALADDRATVAEVVQWWREHQEVTRPVAVLLPTSPFRTPATIRRAVETFQRRACAELLSIVPYEHPPQWALIRNGLGVEPAYPALYAAPRQALHPAWRHDGSYWIVGGEGDGIVAFETPPDEVCDVNTQDDLEWARWRMPSQPAPAAKT